MNTQGGPKLTPSPEPRMGSAGLGRRKKKEPPQREMAPCSLGGKELTGLMFLFLGDAQRLGPRGQGQGGTVSFQGIVLPQLPCCLTPWSYFLQRKTKPPPQPGSRAQLPLPPHPLPKNMPGRCPLLAAGILRTAWGEAPTRVHGCPLVAMRGVDCQASQTLPFGRGTPNS